jgi:cystathionine beta-lyase
VLIPESAYGPTKELGEDLLAGLAIDVERYDPLIGGGIAELIRPHTALIWCESPGSITMEVQDVPAIVGAARERGCPWRWTTPRGRRALRRVRPWRGCERAGADEV